VRCLTSVDRETIGQLKLRDEFFGVDLSGADPEQLDGVRHELALPPPPADPEAGRRRMFEDHDEMIVLLCRGVALADARPFDVVDVTLYVSGDFVLTIHDQPIEELERLRRRLTRVAGQEEEWAVARVLDAIYGGFVEVLDAIDERISEVETDVIERPRREQLERIVELRRELLELRRLVNPQRDTLLRVADDIADLPGLESGDRIHLGEVSDYLGRIADRIDNYGALLTNAMDIYLSTSANRLNEVMWRLTVVATVFLPLTFITGFFGQNFEWLTSHVTSLASFVIWGCLMLAGSALGIYAWVKYTQQRELAGAAQAKARR